MLGEITEQNKKIYLNIKGGRIVRKTEEGEKSYLYVEGVLDSLYQKERTFRGENLIYWYLDIRDRESGELYSLGFPYSSNVFKSIILALASDETLSGDSMVRIEPYSKNGYDKVTVWSEGVKLDWVVKQLPPIETVTVGGKPIKDDSKRMQLITDLSSNVCQCIRRKGGTIQ